MSVFRQFEHDLKKKMRRENNTNIINHSLAQFLTKTCQEIADSKSRKIFCSNFHSKTTRSHYIASELVLQYLSRRGLELSLQCASFETHSKYERKHSDKWLNRELFLRTRSDLLRILVTDRKEHVISENVKKDHFLTQNFRNFINKTPNPRMRKFDGDDFEKICGKSDNRNIRDAPKSARKPKQIIYTPSSSLESPQKIHKSTYAYSPSNNFKITPIPHKSPKYGDSSDDDFEFQETPKSKSKWNSKNSPKYDKRKLSPPISPLNDKNSPKVKNPIPNYEQHKIQSKNSKSDQKYSFINDEKIYERKIKMSESNSPSNDGKYSPSKTTQTKLSGIASPNQFKQNEFYKPSNRSQSPNLKKNGEFLEEMDSSSNSNSDNDDEKVLSDEDSDFDEALSDESDEQNTENKSNSYQVSLSDPENCKVFCISLSKGVIRPPPKRKFTPNTEKKKPAIFDQQKTPKNHNESKKKAESSKVNKITLKPSENKNLKNKINVQMNDKVGDETNESLNNKYRPKEKEGKNEDKSNKNYQDNKNKDNKTQNEVQNNNKTNSNKSNRDKVLPRSIDINLINKTFNDDIDLEDKPKHHKNDNNHHTNNNDRNEFKSIHNKSESKNDQVKQKCQTSSINKDAEIKNPIRKAYHLNSPKNEKETAFDTPTYKDKTIQNDKRKEKKNLSDQKIDQDSSDSIEYIVDTTNGSPIVAKEIEEYYKARSGSLSPVAKLSPGDHIKKVGSKTLIILSEKDQKITYLKPKIDLNETPITPNRRSPNKQLNPKTTLNKTNDKICSSESEWIEILSDMSCSEFDISFDPSKPDRLSDDTDSDIIDDSNSKTEPRISYNNEELNNKISRGEQTEKTSVKKKPKSGNFEDSPERITKNLQTEFESSETNMESEKLYSSDYESAVDFSESNAVQESDFMSDNPRIEYSSKNKMNDGLHNPDENEMFDAQFESQNSKMLTDASDHPKDATPQETESDKNSEEEEEEESAESINSGDLLNEDEDEDENLKGENQSDHQKEKEEEEEIPLQVIIEEEEEEEDEKNNYNEAYDSQIEEEESNEKEIDEPNPIKEGDEKEKNEIINKAEKIDENQKENRFPKEEEVEIAEFEEPIKNENDVKKEIEEEEKVESLHDQIDNIIIEEEEEIYEKPNFYKMNISVLAASCIPKIDLIGTSDPYCTFFFCDNKEKLYSTKVVEDSQNPEWNQHFSFSTNEIQGKFLKFKIFDKDMLGSDQKMNSLKVYLTSRKLDIDEWYEMKSKILVNTNTKLHLIIHITPVFE